MLSQLLLAASLPALAVAKTIDIGVGDGGLVFKPNTTTAAPGDVLAFHFYPREHSAVLGDYAHACQPLSDTSFFSGYYATQSGQNSTVFTVPVNSTAPLWIYCSFATHCQDGMVMVVNPPAAGNQSLAGYAAAAKSAPESRLFAPVRGGHAVPNTIATPTPSPSAARVTGSAGAVRPTTGAGGAGATTAGSAASSGATAMGGAGAAGTTSARASGAGASATSMGAGARVTGMGVLGGAVAVGMAALL